MSAEAIGIDRDEFDEEFEVPEGESWGERLIRFITGNVIWVFVAFFLLWTLGPLFWTASTSFMRPNEVYITTSLFPERLEFAGYLSALTTYRFPVFLWNSLFLAIWTTISTVIISSFAAYAFSRYAFRFRHTLLLAVLIPRLVPRVALIVPLYMMLNTIGLLDTRGALMLTYTASSVPLATWILVGFFHGVPKDLEEAAAVDGASTLQRLRRIVLPMALPGLITVGIFSFRDAWNEFPFVLAFTSSASQRTLPYGLFLLEDAIGLQDWPATNAFAILTILPVLLIYLRFEKQVVSGISKGALK